MITYTRGSVLAVCFGISALLGACGGDDYGSTPAPSSGSASVTLRQAAGGATYLADSEGRALYTFANDLRGDAQNAAESACAAGCLAKWPVFYMETIKTPDGLVASDFATITRDDGSKFDGTLEPTQAIKIRVKFPAPAYSKVPKGATLQITVVTDGGGEKQVETPELHVMPMWAT